MLLDLVLPLEPLWESLRPQLETLTSYAVIFRYPGESATRALAKTAVADYKAIRQAFRNRLGLARS